MVKIHKHLTAVFPLYSKLMSEIGKIEVFKKIINRQFYIPNDKRIRNNTMRLGIDNTNHTSGNDFKLP